MRVAPLAYVVASAVSALWILGLAVATAPFHESGVALSLVILLALGPTALLFGLAYLVRQGDELADASLGPDDQGSAMFGPALRAAAEAGQAADEVQFGLTATTAAADKARDDLEVLRQALTDAPKPAQVVTELVGPGGSSLVRRMKTEGRDLAARSQALDAQLAEAAEVIELHVRRAANAAAQGASQFEEADKSLAASADRLKPAVDRAADVLRLAGRQADRQSVELEAAAEAVGDKARILATAIPGQSESLTSSNAELRTAREAFFDVVRVQGGVLHAVLARLADASREIAARAADAGEALTRALLRAKPASASAPPMDDLPADTSNEAAAPEDLEAAPDAALPARIDPTVEGKARPAAAAPADRTIGAVAPVLTARGIGGQVIFDGSRVLIDRTQSASFIMHGTGGQRSIQLREVVKVRFTPPRRGAHGYLQFVLSRGHEGRGGPADVNSILFDMSQQASFQRMAEVLQRALRHLRRHPDASDPRAPGELAHLMDLRGRGLIDSREFTEATARLAEEKSGLRAWFRRKSRS